MSAARQDLPAAGLPDEAPAGEAGMPPAFWRAFSVIAFATNRFIVDQVIRAARHFDNDVEAMILVGTISHLNVAHILLPGSSPSSVLAADGRVPDSQRQLRPVRLRDLTQITGRPRETIRRKLERLVAGGRLLQVDGGYVLNVASVDHGMRMLSVDCARRLMEAAKVVDDALRDADLALERERGRSGE